MRTGNNQYNEAGNLINGFDYERQAWVENGYYQDCNHPESMNCGCFGRKHHNESWLAWNKGTSDFMRTHFHIVVINVA